MTDIVERLRRDATCSSHHEAADEIERLRTSVNDARNGAVAASECAGQMMQDRDEAYADIEWLRATVSELLGVVDCVNSGLARGECEQHLHHMLSEGAGRARAALTEGER